MQKIGLMLVPSLVALRKESVDRNHQSRKAHRQNRLSLSARRAWIEIFLPIELSRERGASLSARRAWIEMSWFLSVVSDSLPVALRKESVDRNY